ncbi:P-loop NTPase fold protein [Rhodovulum sulfidophilum]|uniref:P-loop NTPase fold protein n=1 Tax=Rhodovulum sulfidophilum TaxID=35806 RepID=UPI00117B8C37|nr:P-loop NTPase fold protein [Rhodovulum sulfidophilum]MBL3553162.1 hypothetical protein [Rhodovulum sulfidophilum]
MAPERLPPPNRALPALTCRSPRTTTLRRSFPEAVVDDMPAKRSLIWSSGVGCLSRACIIATGEIVNQNLAAIRALHEYAGIKKPRYAFMIEAPWGAGKTHLVKHEFKDALSNDKARYVTLNGVSDQRSFRRALLAGTSEAKLMDAAGKLGDTLGKVAKVGNFGSLVQDIVEDRMIENLPKLLIFDDVERCEMSPGELLGLINEFVEHQTRNVVLCAYIERDDAGAKRKKRDDFLSRKEKVVGRTVKIVADAHNALPEFLSSMPSGNGREWLTSNDTLVLEVFHSAKHSNLRVLRQCLHDCGRVIDVLDEDIRTSRASMIRFVRTYLALSMSVATGEINTQQLSDRGDPRSITEPEEGESAHPLYTCFRQHPEAEIYTGNAESILPLDLGISLIGVGYEEHEKINLALRATGQFDGAKDIPLWARFVKWRLMSHADLESTFEEAKSYIYDSNNINPGPYLHIAHDLISIAKDGAGDGAEVAKRIKDQVEKLAQSNAIPLAGYGKEYGWSYELGLFSFGGYAFEPNLLTKPIVESMRNAQIQAFERSRANEAKRLMELFREDLDTFGREFSWNNGGSSYYQTAILHEIDAREFAEVVFSYVTSGDFEAVGAQLKNLADRHRPNIFPEELVWAKTVKTELERLAEEAGKLEKARMVWFLGFNWRFPTDERDDG